MGNDRTSVGPALARCSALRSAMRSASTNSTATWPSAMPAVPSASAASSRTRSSGRASPMTSTSSTAPDAGRRALGMVGIRLDDALHDLVAHDVLVAEVRDADALDPAQDLPHLDQSRALLARQVDLRDV